MPVDSSPSNLPTASQLVRAFGRRARHSLGQHFLTDPVILERLVTLSGVQAGQRVLEIGPGPGTLTRTLLAHGCRVVAVEIDRAAVESLRQNLPHPDLELIEADVLDLDLGPLLADGIKVVANLPYNAATEIFFRLDPYDAIQDMTLMFQREVARRFTAGVGGKPYGPLAILSRIRWDCRIALELPPGAFTPPPKVTSALVRFQRPVGPRVPETLEPLFRRLVHTAFQKRRKQMRNAVAELASPLLLDQAGIDLKSRPEDVDLDGFLRLTRVVASRVDGPRGII